MKKIWIKFICVAAACLLSLGLFACADNTKLSFKEDVPEYFTVNTAVNVSKLVDYDAGASLEVKAEYESNEKTGEYLVSGVTFTPTRAGNVTITVTAGKKSVSKKFIVKIAPPMIIETNEAEIIRNEEIELSSLIRFVNYVADESSSVAFVAKSFMPVGGTEEDKITFTGDKYTFSVGMYELKFTLANDGGETEGVMFLNVKRALGENEIKDISNYKRGMYTPSYASGSVYCDEEDHAENSDWSFCLKAEATATGVSNTVYSAKYWDQFAQIMLEDTINLSESYIEFDVKMSEDARELLGVGFVMDGESSGIMKHFDISPKNEWVHFSSAYKYLRGEYKYIRFNVLHPQTTDASSYNAANVWVKIDNVVVKNYEEPIEEGLVMIDLSASSAAQLKATVNCDGKIKYKEQSWGGYAQSFSVPAILDGEETTLGGFVEEAAPQTYYITGFNAVKGTKLEFAAGTNLSVTDNEDVNFFIKRDVCIYFDGEKWTTEEVKPDSYTLGGFAVSDWCYEHGSSTTLYFDVTSANVPTKVENWLYAGLEIYYNGELLKAEAASCYSGGKSVIVLTGLSATKADRIEFRQGASFITDEITYVFGESFTVYFDGTGWTTKEVVISEYTLGGFVISDWCYEHGSSQTLYFDVTSANVPTKIENWLYAGLDIYYNDELLEASAASCYSGGKSNIILTGLSAVKGDKILFEGGESFVSEGITYVFAEDFVVYFDGASWTAEEVKKDIITSVNFEKSSAASLVLTVTHEFELKLAENAWGGAQSLNVNAKIDGTETVLSGFLEGVAPQTFYLTVAAKKGTKLEIETGAKFVITDNDDAEIIVKDAICIYFDGEKWVDEEVTVDPNSIEGLYISDWCYEHGSSVTLYFDVTSANVPTKVENWLWSGLEIYYNGTILDKILGYSCYSGGAKVIVLTGLSAVKGDKIEFRQGANFTSDGVTYTFGESFTVYFDGTSWTTTEVNA